MIKVSVNDSVLNILNIKIYFQLNLNGVHSHINMGQINFKLSSMSMLNWLFEEML